MAVGTPPTRSPNAVASPAISAPITKGDQLAELVFTLEGLPETRIPLVADRDIGPGGFVSRVTTAAQILINKLIQGPAGAT